MAAAALEIVRPLADEIVVAFDSRIPPDQLGPLESIADTLIGFEFSGANRFRPWLREQAHGDWLLLLDGDEVVSNKLLQLLPELIASRNISGYELPCWWVFPDPASRLVSTPWDEDRHVRLVRNDGRLWFPGFKHTDTSWEPPIRYVDAPFIHLDLLLNSEGRRLEKASAYNNQKFPIFVRDGRLVNEALYLPELDECARVEPIPAPDATLIAAVLSRRDERRKARRPASVALAGEVERWWYGRPQSEFDYRADIVVVHSETKLLAESTARFVVEVANLGLSVWPSTAFAHGGALILLAYHWRDADGSFVVWDGRRTELSSRIAPGERVQVGMIVDTPRAPGRYTLVFDAVHEGARWFGVDREIAVDVEPGIREQLVPVGTMTLVSIKSARTARRRLREPDGLSLAMDPMKDNVSASPIAEDYAMDQAALGYLIAWIHRERFNRILEFGSGMSTLAFASELAPRQGRVLSLDQNQKYADKTAALVATHGLVNCVRVCAVPLGETSVCDISTLSYEFSPNVQRDISTFDPDIVVIDGPSQSAGASRLAVAPMVARLLARPTAFAMHDAFRDAELEIGDRWQREKDIEVDGIAPVGKGLLVGRLLGNRQASS